MTKHMPAPCKDCPFSKAVKPNALGGSDPKVYVGQAHGPFVLPCHKHCDFDDPDWRAKTFDTPQCAGAAIFRTHIGVAERMPRAIHTLPASDAVFANEAELLAHHYGCTVESAKQILKLRSPGQLMRDELGKAAVITRKV